jgi:hypothetical protein
MKGNALIFFRPFTTDSVEEAEVLRFSPKRDLWNKGLAIKVMPFSISTQARQGVAQKAPVKAGKRMVKVSAGKTFRVE